MPQDQINAAPQNSSGVAEQPIVVRLREGVGNRDIEAVMREAADMLEVLLGQLQMTDCRMDSQHHFRFRHGWPMTHAIGPTGESAIKSVVAEVKRSNAEKWVCPECGGTTESAFGKCDDCV